jgi:hypothetical protein
MARFTGSRLRLIAAVAAAVSAFSAAVARREEWKHGVLAENG